MRSPTRRSIVPRSAAPISEHASDEHAAAAGDRVVLLAARANVREYVIGDALRVELAGLRDLLKRGRVDVEHLDVAENLVLSTPRRIVEPPGLLRHRAGRLEYAMRS